LKTSGHRVIVGVMRSFALLLLTGMAGLLVASAGSAAPGDFPIPPCSPTVTTDCIVSVERNGAVIPPSSYTDPTEPYVVSAVGNDDGTTRQYSFTVSRSLTNPDPFSLDPTDIWEVVIDTGSTVPYSTFERGRDVAVSRTVDGSGDHRVVFKMQPVRMAVTAHGCHGTGACGGPMSAADKDHSGYLDGWISDVGFISDPLDRAARRGV